MKYAKYLLGIFSFILLCVGCTDSSPYLNADWKLSIHARYLSIDKKEFTFGANSNLSQTLKVSSVSTGWALADGDAWVSASQTSGSADADVVLTASENRSGDDLRTCIINFSSTETDYSYTRPIALTQSKAEAYINPNQQTVSFTRDASTQSIPVDANTRWQVTCSESWVTAKVSDDRESLQITVEENNGTTERSASIYLEGNARATIVVKQAGSRFDGVVASLMFGNKASTQDVSIETNGRWSATTSNGWITLSPATGAGTTLLSVSVASNPDESERSGVITVTVGDISKQILVTQAGTYFTVDATDDTAIPSTGGTHAVTFTSSDSWKAASNSTWVRHEPASGQMGQSSMTIIFGDNPSVYNRRDTTYILPDNDNLQPYRIITLQQGRYLALSTDSLGFAKEQGSQSFKVSTDGAYTPVVSDEANWVTCKATDNIVTVTTAENTSPLPRIAFITVRLTDVPEAEQALSEQEVMIWQDGVGYYLKTDLETPNISVGSSAATPSFTVLSNDTWTSQSSVTWAKLSASSGSGDKLINVEVEANTGAEKRSGVITLTGTHSDPVTITIEQSGIGYYLQIKDNIESISAGTAAMDTSFGIESNDTWTVSSNGTWAQVSPASGSGNGTIAVSIAENSGAEDRDCTITVIGAKSATMHIAIHQTGVGYYLNVDKSSISADAAAKTVSVTITSNDNWIVSTDESWLTVSPQSGDGNQTLNVTIDASTNPESRSGKISIKGSHSAEKTIDVLQAGIGYYLKVNNKDSEMLAMTATAASTTFAIESNDEWEITSSASWATVSPTSGSGDKTVTLSCTANNNPEPRSCQITAKSTHGKTAAINLTQDGQGYTTEVSTTSIVAESDQTTATFSIMSNDSWTATSSVAWAKLSATTGTGSKDVSVAIEANPSEEKRTGTITVQGNHSATSAIIELTQAGMVYCYADLNTLSVGAIPTPKTITVSGNVSWEVSATVPWISIPTPYGNGNQSFTVEFEKNEDDKTRNGQIVLTGEGCERYVINVMQTCFDDQPWLSFTADGPQTLQFTYEVPTLEYSVNDSEWQELGTKEVAFGGNTGELRLRGKSSYGTIKQSYWFSEELDSIKFSANAKVACHGDIRTLVDYENYYNINGQNVKFSGLFKGCYQLITAPKLPATTLAGYCYFLMFSGCSSLTNAPSLPATTLASSCYDGMFSHCSSLTNAPSLPATTLAYAYGCYSSMFSGCSSLTNAPSLPATTLASSCYDGMFSHCSSLTNAPSLPATTLADYCYRGMFSGCSSLTNAPSLPATTLASSCYSGMFSGCSCLTNAPSLPATTLASFCYSGMFSGCSSLTNAPSLPATTLASSCYSGMFSDCSSLTNAPSLPATTLADYCYCRMFSDCSSLTNAPSLPATTLASSCYCRMFEYCSSLTNAPSLPATTLADYCYDDMFFYCSSLTKAPDLPAKTLVESCYFQMLCYCYKVNTIKMMATDISAENCLGSWTYHVSSSGTFIKNAAAKWDETGVVPTGWTVITE